MPEMSRYAGRQRPAEPPTIQRPPPISEPYRVSFSPSGVEVAGRLANSDDAERMIRAIEALKALLPAAPSLKAEPQPDDAETARAAAEGVSLMITQLRRESPNGRA